MIWFLHLDKGKLITQMQKKLSYHLLTDDSKNYPILNISDVSKSSGVYIVFSKKFKTQVKLLDPKVFLPVYILKRSFPFYLYLFFFFI